MPLRETAVAASWRQRSASRAPPHDRSFRTTQTARRRSPADRVGVSHTADASFTSSLGTFLFSAAASGGSPVAAGPVALLTNIASRCAASASADSSAGMASSGSFSADSCSSRERRGEPRDDCSSSESTSLSYTRRSFPCHRSPSLASLASELELICAAFAARCSDRSCCAREVNGHLRGARPSLEPVPDRDAPARSNDVVTAAAAAAWSPSGAIMAV